jgi:hypothetical protein
MNYLITKKEPDSRYSTCGFIMPDGFFTVVGLTLRNQDQIKNISRLYDLSEEPNLPEGTYTSAGYRIDPGSVVEWMGGTGELVYIDEQPPKGASLVSGVRDIRPPDLSMRPEHVDMNMVDVDAIEVPPAVIAAREAHARQVAAGTKNAPAPTRAQVGAQESTDIPVEKDMDTLQGAGGDHEVAMLRASLDVRGITYHPTAKAPALRKKLQAAEDAA